MSADVWLARTDRGISFADDESRQWFMSKPIGKVLHMTARAPRDPTYHRKAMSLIRMAFDNWDAPATQFKDMDAEKSFERFRDDLVILAGYYKPVARLNGDSVLEAQSLSYGKCSQELIEKIYSSLVDVISKRFSNLASTPDELDRLTEQWMRYV